MGSTFQGVAISREIGERGGQGKEMGINGHVALELVLTSLIVGFRKMALIKQSLLKI
jgi:hypothetical protein